jgi:hypothetical protein
MIPRIVSNDVVSNAQLDALVGAYSLPPGPSGAPAT